MWQKIMKVGWQFCNNNQAYFLNHPVCIVHRCTPIGVTVYTVQALGYFLRASTTKSGCKLGHV